MSRVLNLIVNSEKTDADVSQDEKTGIATKNPHQSHYPTVTVLDVPITNITADDLIEYVGSVLSSAVNHPKMLFFANAHTLNLAARNPDFRAALRGADHVFGDGTGVRWAASMRNAKLIDNVNGTDFTPRLLSTRQATTKSYYLLGADPQTIHRAAQSAQERFQDWRLAGFHHGFIQSDIDTAAAIERINQSSPDVLLVGMGNPLQELWIQRNIDKLDVKVCIGVGGLFDFWSGNFSRAPRWLRRIGHEWLWRLWQQPIGKFNRYLIGNPLFLLRSIACARQDHWRQELTAEKPRHLSEQLSRTDSAHRQGKTPPHGGTETTEEHHLDFRS